MIGVRLSGGIGNQLFQYAFMRHLEELKFPDVFLDDSWYTTEGKDQADAEGNPQVRTLDLDKFQTSYRLLGDNLRYCTTIIHEDNGYNDMMLFQKNAYVMGYWQDIGYLQYVRGQLDRECRLKPAYITGDMRAMQARLEDSETIALHVRRGDYLNDNNRHIYAVCTAKYYADAVTHIRQTTGKEPVLFIFSDDPAWAAENMHGFCGCDTVIMKMRSAWEDLYLMSCAGHNIIANSSFSWWAAFLNRHPEHITIAPRNWFLEKPNPHLYFPEWIVM